MMFDRMLKLFTPKYAPVYLPKLDYYLDRIDTILALTTSRYQGRPVVRTQGLSLLRQVLASIPYHLIQPHHTMYDILMVLIEHQDELIQAYDPTTLGNIRRNLFFSQKTGSSCMEVIIPTMSKDYLRTHPMDGTWDEWRYVTPLRIIDVDSLEFTTHLHTGTLQYHYDPPSRVVLVLDPIALALQYIQYQRDPDTPSEYDIYRYLQDYVVNPVILSDVVSIWLFRVYMEQADTLTPLPFLGYTRIEGYQQQAYSEGMKDILSLLRSGQKGAIPPNRVIASLPLVGGVSLTSYVRQLRDEHQVMQTGASWLMYLRDLHWMTLGCAIYTLDPDHSDYKTFKAEYRRIIDAMIVSRFWNRIQDPLLRQTIEGDLLMKQEWIRTLS